MAVEYKPRVHPFNPSKTGPADFGDRPFQRDVFARIADQNTTTSGFIEGARQFGYQLWALPSLTAISIRNATAKNFTEPFGQSGL